MPLMAALECNYQEPDQVLLHAEGADVFCRHNSAGVMFSVGCSEDHPSCVIACIVFVTGVLLVWCCVCTNMPREIVQYAYEMSFLHVCVVKDCAQYHCDAACAFFECTRLCFPYTRLNSRSERAESAGEKLPYLSAVECFMLWMINCCSPTVCCFF